MNSSTVAALMVLFLPWECCSVILKSDVVDNLKGPIAAFKSMKVEIISGLKNELNARVKKIQNHREDIIKWKKVVAKDLLNSVRRSSLLKKVKASKAWKQLEDIMHSKAHSYTGDHHGPSVGRLLRFFKQASTDTDIWEGAMWNTLGFEEALIYDPDIKT